MSLEFLTYLQKDRVFYSELRNQLLVTSYSRLLIEVSLDNMQYGYVVNDYIEIGEF